MLTYMTEIIIDVNMGGFKQISLNLSPTIIRR